MKKNIAFILAALMLTAVVGCSKKSTDNSATTQTSDNSATTQTSDNSAATQTAETTQSAQTAHTAGTAVENASKEVDMDKVAGKEATDVETEADEAVIGGYEVSIEDAKVIDYNEDKVIIVSFDFENNTPSPIAFDGAMTVDISQNDTMLRGTVVTGVEGVNINSAFETVKSGDDITLQKAYILEDETAAVDVAVYKYGESDSDTVTKTFNIQ